MAIYHLTAKVISRGKGQSAIAAAAYRSGERLRDEQTGELKAYAARSERIQFTDIMTPKDAPEWAHERNTLWNNAERAEKRKDAQLAREIEIALPHELTAQQREWLVKDFAREAFVRAGYVVDIAIHAPDKESDARNHHAHLMVTRRTIGPEGFSAKKDWQFDPKQLDRWREQWEHLANRHLERHGHEARIDRRSLKTRGIDREPDIHIGYAAAEIARRGGDSDRVVQLADIRAANAERAAVKGEIRELDREALSLEQEQAAERKAEEKRQREQAEQEAEQQRQNSLEAQRQSKAEAERERARIAERKAEGEKRQEAERQEKAQQEADRQEAARKAGVEREQAAQREAAAAQTPAPAKVPAPDARRDARDRLAGAFAAILGEPAKEQTQKAPAPAPVSAQDAERARQQAEADRAVQKATAEQLDHKKMRAEQTGEQVAKAADPRQAALEKLARADAAAQREPVAKSFTEGAKEQAREIRAEIRHEQREAAFWQGQEAWHARNTPRPTMPVEAVLTPAQKAFDVGKGAARTGLMVADKISGKVMGLADFVGDFLGGSSAAERPANEQNRARAAAFLNNPQGRMQRQMEQLAQEQRAALAERAWETIREDIQAGRALKAEEVRNLPREALEQIRQFGDEAVRQMVQEAEKRAERYWKGEERERERDW